MKNLILIIALFLATSSFAGSVQSVRTSDDKIIINERDGSTKQVFNYQTDTYIGDGDITSGSFIAIKEGNRVTILCDSVITHGNFSAPQSSVGLIGEDYRPTANASNVFDQSGSRVMKIRIGTDGRVRFEYFDWAGVAVTNTNTNSICSITYYVP